MMDNTTGEAAAYHMEGADCRLRVASERIFMATVLAGPKKV